MRIMLVQGNPVVGDLEGNAAQAVAAHRAAAEAQLLVLSELFLTGYPPEDLILRPAFLAATERALAELAATCGEGAAVLIGAPHKQIEAAPSREAPLAANSAFLLAEGKVQARHDKIHLPNYEVFDEKRRFIAGNAARCMQLEGLKLGVLVCEDMWLPAPAAELKQAGAEMLIVLNGSPYEAGRHEARLTHARARVKETGLPLIYVNQLGGQDELVFDGASFVLNSDGEIAAQAPAWVEANLLTEWRKEKDGWHCVNAPISEIERGEASLWQAICLGLRDYVEKNGFPGVVIGLSGGVDSAVCAALAVDALGAERVHCLAMPSQHTSNLSHELARECADNLGVRLDWLDMTNLHQAIAGNLGELPDFTLAELADENIQARIRGLLLMAVSNSTGAMVLTTGNKSELSVGYATLYGDMNGGFNPLRDIYKTQLYDLARWRNKQGVVIPPDIITRPPSAELRPEQKDEDSLPPYPVLDEILRRLIDEEESLEAIIKAGYDAELVRRIALLVRRAEYKRRQAAPGVKLGPRPFGQGRRYPITNRFSE